MFKSVINGVGKYLPERVVTNHDLEKLMDTSDEWIVQRSGISERRWADIECGTADLAYQAALNAINNSSIEKEEIDFIVFATITPDHFFPGSGCLLQDKLGLKTVPALDIKQQCTGFIYALSIADQFIKTGMYKNILVVGAELQSKALDKTTRGRDVAVLFGDGAGAVILSAEDPTSTRGIISSHLHAQGKYVQDLWVEAPGMALANDVFITEEALKEGRHFPKMNGKKVYVHAITRMCESIREGLEFNNLNIEDVDLFLFHQANLRINNAVAQKLNIPSEKVFNTIEKYGNTTAATIPIGMNDALEQGVLKPGMLVALSAFGSGFTWGSTFLRY